MLSMLFHCKLCLFIYLFFVYVFIPLIFLTFLFLNVFEISTKLIYIYISIHLII